MDLDVAVTLDALMVGMVSYLALLMLRHVNQVPVQRFLFCSLHHKEYLCNPSSTSLKMCSLSFEVFYTYDLGPVVHAELQKYSPEVHRVCKPGTDFQRSATTCESSRVEQISN